MSAIRDKLSIPPVLLLTDYGPDEASGGAVIFRALVEHLEPQRLIWCSCEAGPEGERPSFRGIRRLGLPMVHRGTRWGLHHLRREWNGLIWPSKAARKLGKIVRAEGTKLLWVLANGAPMWAGFLAARELRLPIHLTVHDDPPELWRRLGYPRRWLRRISGRFSQVYHESTSRDVITEGMDEHYRSRFGVAAQAIVHMGVRREDLDSNKDHPPHDRSIVLAGTAYCLPELRMLARAVAIHNSRIRPELRTRVEIYGQPGYGLDLDSLGSEIVFRGWQPQEIVETRLRMAGLAYLPMPFDPIHSLTVKTSLPTKAISYLRAGVPILCHAPAYSSVCRILGSRDVGPAWNSLDPKEGARLLERVFDTDERKRFRSAIRSLGENEFSQEIMARRLAKCLNEASGVLR